MGGGGGVRECTWKVTATCGLDVGGYSGLEYNHR